MKKLYSISYQHIGGERHLQTTDITKIAEWIFNATEDEYVIQSSIVIETKEVEA